MRRRYKWFLAFMAVSAVVAIWVVRAQEMDESGVIVAEDMLIDELLSGDIPGEDAVAEDLLDTGMEEELEAAFAEELAEEKGVPAQLPEVVEDDFDALAAELFAEEPVEGIGEEAVTALEEALPTEEMPLDETVASLEDASEPAVEVEEAALADLEFETEPADAVAEVDETALFGDAEPALVEEEPFEEPMPEMEEAPAEFEMEDAGLLDEFFAEGADEPVAEMEEVAEPFVMEEAPEPEPIEEVVAEAPAAEWFEPEEMAEVDEPLPIEEVVAEAPAAEWSEPEETPELPMAGAPAASMSLDMEREIAVMKEAEELRRRAYQEHAREKLAAGVAAMEEKDYIAGRRYYEQALNALQQLAEREQNRDDIAQAKWGIMDSIYRQAVLLQKQGDLGGALQLARDARAQGHPDAPKLVARIEKLQEKPPEKPAPTKRWEQPDFVAKQDEVGTLLREGRQQYQAGEYDAAMATIEMVLKKDAYNTEAIRWRHKISQARLDTASKELASTRVDMMAELRKTWNPRDYGVEKQQTPDLGQRGLATGTEDSERIKILKKMEGIIIPEIDFREAYISDVVQFLQAASEDYDMNDDPNAKKGVNMILHLGGGQGAATAAAPSATEDFDWFSPAEETQGAPSEVPLITFRARDLSLREALDTVTRVASLKYRIEGSIVMILPFNAPIGRVIHRMYGVLPTFRDRVVDFTASMDRGTDSDFRGLPGMEIGEDKTDLRAFFETMGVEWPTGSSITYIPAIGKIIVANTADNLTVLEQILAELNVVPNQIEIEARFVEVAQTDLSSLGFEYILTDNWELMTKKNQGNVPLGGQQRIQMNQGSFTRGNRFLTDLVPEVDDFWGTDNILSVASVLTNPEMTFILHALEQNGNADLLSAPKVTTQSGMEAEIKVVTEYIYPSDYEIEPGVSPTLNADGTLQTAGTPPVVTPAEFEIREVGVILTVLPDVSSEGQMINLTLAPAVVSDPTWRNYGQTYTDTFGNLQQIPIEQPFFPVRSIQTTISIYNGATVVMGGMINERRYDTEDKIPLLGDLPLIGRMFRSTYENSEKRNLLIFVTARLVDPAGRPSGRGQEITSLIGSGTPAE